jgi:hypothetical protein
MFGDYTLGMANLLTNTLRMVLTPTNLKNQILALPSGRNNFTIKKLVKVEMIIPGTQIRF